MFSVGSVNSTKREAPNSAFLRKKQFNNILFLATWRSPVPKISKFIPPPGNYISHIKPHPKPGVSEWKPVSIIDSHSWCRLGSAQTAQVGECSCHLLEHFQWNAPWMTLKWLVNLSTLKPPKGHTSQIAGLMIRAYENPLVSLNKALSTKPWEFSGGGPR